MWMWANGGSGSRIMGGIRRLLLMGKWKDFLFVYFVYFEYREHALEHWVGSNIKAETNARSPGLRLQNHQWL
jgi:hypothetical protein